MTCITSAQTWRANKTEWRDDRGSSSTTTAMATSEGDETAKKTAEVVITTPAVSVERLSVMLRTGR
ncbi:hypothetical protein [Prochlorococcus sp. MIT 1306]|uniref:hypothetical protein n=1 Tax=Prochlorococcus sp. MIT 1306 TaxID=1799667 RepID=UPI0012E9703C|nr:hypothetical protein [Prochlorococcus sp. MIT 1306]